MVVFPQKGRVMKRKLHLYDHLEPGNPKLKKIFDQITEISKEINRIETVETNLRNADLVLGHFEDDDMREIINRGPAFHPFPDKQVIVFLTTQHGFPEHPQFKHSIITYAAKQRAVLFVRNMNALSHNITLKKLIRLTLEQAINIIENQDGIFGEKYNPFKIQDQETRISPKWKIKHRAFYHDWLQYFLQDINAFIKTGCSEFQILDKRFPQWRLEKRKEAESLVTGDNVSRAIKNADSAYQKCENRDRPDLKNFLDLKDAFHHLAEVLRDLDT